jgi:hypothetical protein
MPVSAKDALRVKLGEKRHRDWKKSVQSPPSNPRDKEGALKRCRHPRKEPEYVPELVDAEQAIRSGGVTPEVTMRSADAKFGKWHREFSGTILQGKIHVSTIDGHIYGSVQKVGRSLEEAARDEGMGRLGQVIGKGKDYIPKPFAESRPNSPFKRAGKSPFTVIYKKG